MARFQIATMGVALLIASATAGAQGQRQDRGQRPAHAGEARGARGNGGEMALFRNISLTETQRTQIKQIRDRYQDQFKTQREQMRAQRPDGERQRPDSAQLAQRRAQAEATMAQHRLLRERQVAEMRAVLTPEQRVTFDQNVAETKARMEQRGNGARKGGKGKKARNG